MKKLFILSSVALMAGAAFADNYALKVTTPEAKPNAWDSQVFINFPAPLEAGKAYTLKMDVKGSYNLEPKEGQWGPEAIQPIVQDNNSENRDQWGGPNDLQYLSHFTVTEEWVNDVLDCNGNAIVTDGAFPYSRLLLNLGNLDGDIYIDNVRMVDAEGNEAFNITFDTEAEQALVEDGWMGLAKEFVWVDNGFAAGTIGEPQWGVERGMFPEDMINLGVPVRFPELTIAEGIALEECEVTVSASLYGVPQGNEPMPISEDDDVDPGMGVDGPVCLAEAVLHVANVEGGIPTAYLFAEQLEVGNHYAIVLNAVTVTKDDEVLAELDEDAYLAIEFDVVPAGPVVTLGEPVWGVDGDEESGYILGEDAVALGVSLSYPDMVLPEGVNPNEATYTLTASLYISGGIMPLDGEDDADVNEGGMEDDPDVDPEFGVDGDECIVESAEFVGYVEGGVLRFNLFPEVCAADMNYTAIVEKIVVADGEQVIIDDEPATRLEFTVVPVETPEELEIEPTFVCGEEEITLTNHSAASVEMAESLVVNFINGPMIMNASYAIDKCLGANEDGIEQYESLASGFLSLSTVGYVAFEQPLVFISGQQYKLTVKAWDVPELFDEDWNLAEPVAIQEFVFNGAASVGVIGEPVWGIDRHELPEDMINLGVKVSFPELTLPFGYAVEDCNIVVAASLYSVPEEQGEDVALYSDDDDIDPGFGVDGPELLAMDIFTADSEGGVVSAWLFAEQLEVGGHYAIMLNAVTVIDGEDVIAELPEDAYYAIEFTVVPVEDITSLNGINAENAKVIYNLNGQKANEAKGIVILNAKKVMVK